MPSFTSASAGAVLVVAPPTLYRQGLLTTLRETWPNLSLTITADSAELLHLVRQKPFALVVLDDALAGPRLLQLLRQLYLVRGQLPVVVLTGRQLPLSHEQLQTPLGACLLSRHTSPPELVRAIGRCVGGSRAEARRGRALPGGPPTPFSRRELEVLRLIVGDYDNREIAQQLSLSVRTVESHRRAMLQKTGTRTLIGLVVQAVRKGWVADRV